MDKRTAYAEFQETILGLYDQNVLTLNLLDHVASRYRWVEIDSAGSRHLQTRDCKNLHQVCIELVDPIFPLALKGSRENDEEYWEQELKKWEEIVHKRWNWQMYCNPFPARIKLASTA